ncbi:MULTISPECIES: YncE family protein [Pseudomonas fluorescens group]|uniref:YncE family protein n=1 Tax=Pseudomonas fluorescens group TaxID=136843 RepID=UPI00087D57C7|nr:MULTISPECIES: YncE family protein [Pseudomonas fluorescens group]SDU38584.1 40-residue YVTN family beta-propeller repeat-containing protein [Pseudomonas moraviensis]
MSSPQKPLLLAELGIPGRSKDPVSKDPDVWGINIAAALDNFPYHGLRCEAGPWGNMASGDRLTIFWGTGHNVLTQTVLKDEVDTQLRMFVPSRHMVDGEFAVSYSVKPLGGTDQPSEVMQVLVKLTRPGGHDNNGDDGHSRLIMIIAQEILDGGIHEGNVAAGVDISIGKADGTPPYPFAAAGDICRVSWGGIFVLSAPLTQDQAEGTAPIIVKIKEDIIREAGDAGGPGIPGVAVVFEVYDKVFNRSEDWSPEQRVVVAVHATRLGAPLLKEALNNVLDVDQLGDADGTVQVVATDNAHFKIGDIPFIKIKGTPVEGPPIDLEIEGLPLISVPSVVETKAPNAVLRQLAKSQITVSYRLKKADGSADLISNGQFIRAIGEVQRLAAPIMLDENSGALDPALPQVRLEIPFDKSFAEGQELNIFMLGTTSGLKPYLPALPTRPITHNDIVAAKPLSYSIDGNHLTPVNGGTAEFYYQLLIPSAAFAKLDAYQASHAIRESIHTDILRVGKPRRELPEPVVAGVVDGVLPADTPGTTATIIYTETVKGDEAFMFWVGSITGEYPDSIKLNEFTAGKEIPFTIPAAMIKDNEGGTVVARYEIKRADGRTSYAEPLEFRVGVALDLKEPKIKQAPNDTSLDPLEAQNALTSVINYDGMLVGDRIIVRLTGAPGTPAAGSHTTEPWPVTTVGPQEIPLAVSVLAFNLAKSITLDYTVTRGTQDPKESRIRALAVLQLRVDLSHSPKIIQAADGGNGTDLDVSTLTAAATLRGGFWPHIASGQRVWMRVEGTKKDDKPYTRTLWTGPSNAVNALWISQGYLDASLPLADLQWLKDQSELAVTFMSTPDHSTDENLALSFPVRTYTVKAVEDAVLVKFTNAPYVIAPRGRLKDIEVQLSNLDGTPLQGTVTLDLPADFSFSDGGSGSRDFPSDIEGKVSVRGVTGAQTSGSYNLVASKGASVGEASATVTAQGQLKNIPIGGGSWDVKISADGTRIYVSSWQKKNLSIIDTATHEIITTIENITGAHGVAISPDERFCYVSNRSVDKISVIDLHAKEVIQTVDTGGDPTGLILSLDGRWLFSCNYSSGTITRCNTDTFAAETIPAGRNPRQGFAGPDGKSIYICNQTSSELSIIDIATFTRRAIVLPAPALGITINHAGDSAYIATATGISVIEIEQEVAIRHIESIGGHALITSKTDDYLYITNISEDLLHTINLSTGAAGPAYPIGSGPRHLVSSMDGGSMYVCNYGSTYLSWVEL